MPKKRYMHNVRPLFVSLVSKAANRREFLMRKDDDGHDVETVQVPILKSEDIDGVRYITGVAYEPGVEDTQGDQMTTDEIAKAAHLYMRDYRGVDVQHSNEQEPGCWVAESSILKADTEIGGKMVPQGAWVFSTGIENPDVIERIDKGELNGFSIGGFAQYVIKADTSDETPPKWFQKLWNALVDRFGMKEPAEPTEPADAPAPQKESGAKQDEPAPEMPEEGEKKVKKSELTEIVNGLSEQLIAKGVMEDDTPPVVQPVAKTETISPAQPDIAAIIKSAVEQGVSAGISAGLKAQPQPEAPAPAQVEKAEGGDGEKEVEKSDEGSKGGPITTGELSEIIKSAVDGAVDAKIAPLTQTVETIAKAYNVGPKNLNGTSQPVQKSDGWEREVLGL